jgi:hypothetical protein
MQPRWATYPRECLDLFDIVLENRWLLSLVESIKLGNVVDLNIVLDSIT